MNSQELHDAISLLDEELIRDVDLLRHNNVIPKRKSHVKRYISVAACLCVLIIGAAAFGMSDSFSKSPAFIEQFISNDSNGQSDSKYGNSDQYLAETAENDTNNTQAVLRDNVKEDNVSADAYKSSEISITVEVTFIDETLLKGLIIQSEYSFKDNEIVFKLTDTTYEAASAAAVGSKVTVVCTSENIFEEYVIPAKIIINEGE